MKIISINLGEHYNQFISSQVTNGRFENENDVIKAALSLLEDEDSKKKLLVSELQKGEISGFVENFDRNTILQHLHQKHLTEK